MTGNVTDLATSQRLAKVWPCDDARQCIQAWLQLVPGKWYLGGSHESTYSALPWYAARTLSELGTKIREMKLRGNIYISAIDISCVLLAEEDVIRGGETDTIINALGAAVAEALERAGEGGKKV